ncbi:MAG: porin family protein [Xanthobacteraceae bacterium]|nr:porin family protein [Xanthobacteraceae bacterium]QYK44833.1 MAG: porin family protein [Xanthobacteraceae bacterium]
MKFRLALAAIAFAFAASAASAADLKPVYKAQPYAVNWNGWYAGLGVAYHQGDINESGCVGACPVNQNIDGAFLAVQAGFDRHLNRNWVLGAFVTTPITKVKDELALTPPVATFAIDPRFAVLGAVRVGYATGNVLPYAFGGIFVANQRATASFGGTDSATHVGPALGVGIEYALNPRWSLDLRYTYTDLSKEPYDFGGGITRLGEEGHTVQFAINYRFGR